MRHNAFFLFIFLLLIASCKSPEARRPVQQNSTTFITKSVERNKKIFEAEKKKIEKIINENPDTEYITSESGFWYYYNVKDSLAGDMPKFGDEISFRYNIKKLNGTTVISEEENGLQTVKVDQTNQDLISGLRDGLKLMKEGETITFLLPSYKAYGYYGIQDKLGANVPVQSTVTLQNIEQTIEN